MMLLDVLSPPGSGRSNGSGDEVHKQLVGDSAPTHTCTHDRDYITLETKSFVLETFMVASYTS
jgi:hypothetical protein